MWLGFRDESNEVFVGTTQGVVKVRTVRRKGTAQSRWDEKLFNSVKGTPWQPEPGRTGMDVRANITLDRATEGIPQEAMGTPRVEKGLLRPKINKSDVANHRGTIGCRACEASKRGEKSTGTSHTEACRERFARIWEEEGDPRYERLLKKIVAEGERQKFEKKSQVSQHQGYKKESLRW